MGCSSCQTMAMGRSPSKLVQAPRPRNRHLAQVGKNAGVRGKPLEGLLARAQAPLFAPLLPKQGVQHISRGSILANKAKAAGRQGFNGAKVTRRGDLASAGHGRAKNSQILVSG